MSIVKRQGGVITRIGPLKFSSFLAKTYALLRLLFKMIRIKRAFDISSVILDKDPEDLTRCYQRGSKHLPKQTWSNRIYGTFQYLPHS